MPKRVKVLLHQDEDSDLILVGTDDGGAALSLKEVHFGAGATAFTFSLNRPSRSTDRYAT